MDDEIRDLLEKEIKSEIEGLSSLEQGSEGHSTAVESVSKLYKLKIEETKSKWDNDEKYNRRLMDKEQNCLDTKMKERQMDSDDDARERELELKRKQLHKDIWLTSISCGVQLIGTVIGIAAYNAWLNKGLKFEETGTITTPETKNLLSKMIPRKN